MRAALRSGSVAHLSSSAFLRLDALPGPGPRAPPLYGALSASPRRRCWNFIRFLHLSLSCTPVRPLRRVEVGCGGGAGGSARVPRARGTRGGARRADAGARGRRAARPAADNFDARPAGAESSGSNQRFLGRAVEPPHDFCAGRGRRGGNAGRARLGPGAGDALEHFEVRVVTHLLPRPDAVLLHGVAKRLLLLVVPVPSEWHLRSSLFVLRLGRLGFHRDRSSLASRGRLVRPGPVFPGLAVVLAGTTDLAVVRSLRRARANWPRLARRRLRRTRRRPAQNSRVSTPVGFQSRGFSRRNPNRSAESAVRALFHPVDNAQRIPTQESRSVSPPLGRERSIARPRIATQTRFPRPRASGQQRSRR